MKKQIQIDFSLFCELYDYFFGENAPTGYAAEEIRKQLEDKADKIISRELFSRYKRTPTGAEREQARQEYLNHKGIHKDWRSETEIPTDKI